MESNWRLNIAKLGMSGTDWTLCARLLLPDDPVKFYLVNFWGTRPGQYEIWRYAPFLDDGMPTLYLGPFYFPGTRFPAVWDVEPDTPS